MRRVSPIVLAVAAAILIIVACQPTDTTPPTVSITYPADGASLAKDTIRIKAYALDETNLSKVEFRIDGVLPTGGSQTTGKEDTFSYLWDAKSAATGGHGITAKAYDAAGNHSMDSVYVTLRTGGGGGGDTSYHHSGEIAASDTWYPRNNPHIIDADVYVDNNATLVIMPGCIVKFNSGTELYCGYSSPGAIIAIGKADTTILFTSNASSPNKGDWKDVGVYTNAMPTTQFAYCTFEYGGSSADIGEIFESRTKVTKLDHCAIWKSGDYGVVCEDMNSSFASLTNSIITACTRYPIDIYPPNVAVIDASNTLTGNTQEGIFVESGTGTNGIISNATWHAMGVPYVLNGNVEVSDPAGPVLTIEPGNTIKLVAGAELYCGYTNPGGIIANGTASSPIIFTSAVATPNAGDWKDVGIYTDAVTTTQFSYCTFEYGGYSADQGGFYESRTKVTKLDHCTIRKSADYGVVCDDENSSFASFTNNTVTTCAKYPIYIYPGNVAAIGAGCALTGNASGYDGIWVKSGTGTNGVTSSATWLNLGVPYVLSGNVEVSAPSGPALTIAPGTTIKLANDAEFYCGYTNAGAIIADGTAGQITFTSILTSPAPGSWRDIGLYSGSTSATLLKHCKIEYAGNSSGMGDIYIDNTAAPTIQNDSIGYSANWGIYLNTTTHPDPTQLQTQNTFYNDASGDVYVPPVH